MHSEAAKTVTRATLMLAIRKFLVADAQTRNRTFGRSLSIEEIAELLDRESGFTELYEALQRAMHANPGNLKWRELARAALAKARGEQPHAK